MMGGRSQSNRIAVMNATMRHRQNTAIMNNRRIRPAVVTTVQAVADMVDTSGATAVDLNALAALLRDAVREGVSAGLAAQRVDEQAPMFGSVGRFLSANEGLLALVSLIVAVLALVQDHQANERPDPPPAVTVQVQPPDRAEIERIVEERLREQEQREQERDGGAHGEHRQG